MKIENLDKIPGIIGYAVVNGEDGSIVDVKGSSTNPLGDLAAFFSSAGEVIKNSLALGEISHIALRYGAHQLVIFLEDSKYLGIEIERDNDAGELLKKIKTAAEQTAQAPAAPKLEVPRTLSSKVQQINLLVEEFGADADPKHWVEILNQGLGILAGDLLPHLGIINQRLAFKESPGAEKEDDFVQALRSIIDFLVKKAVEEMGSSQARSKVQAVIERMRQA